MAILEITMQKNNIDFAPATIYEEILQNVRTILTTAKFTVPLDRNFGLNAALLDMPISSAQAKLTAEIIASIHRYEPRVTVKKVSYENTSEESGDGILLPKVQVEINGI